MTLCRESGPRNKVFMSSLSARVDCGQDDNHTGSDHMTDQTTTAKPWYKRTWFIVLAVIVVLAAIGRGSKDGPSSTQTAAESTAGSAVTEAPAAAPAEVPKASSVGEKVSAGYFDVTVNSVQKVPCVGSNQFSQKCAGEGNEFLVLDVSLKNTDTEGRMFTDGSIFVTYKGKELEFDDTETILENGYLTLETLNPLTSTRGKIVYKVPAGLDAALYWNPGRSDVRILIAEGS